MQNSCCATFLWCYQSTMPPPYKKSREIYAARIAMQNQQRILDNHLEYCRNVIIEKVPDRAARIALAKKLGWSEAYIRMLLVTKSKPLTPRLVWKFEAALEGGQ